MVLMFYDRLENVKKNRLGQAPSPDIPQHHFGTLRGRDNSCISTTSCDLQQLLFFFSFLFILCSFLLYSDAFFSSVLLHSYVVQQALNLRYLFSRHTRFFLLVVAVASIPRLKGCVDGLRRTRKMCYVTWELMRQVIAWLKNKLSAYSVCWLTQELGDRHLAWPAPQEFHSSVQIPAL